MITKKIYIVTSSRADYDHLFWLINALQKYKCFKIVLIITGNHFEKKFGNSFKNISIKKIKKIKIRIKYSGDRPNSSCQQVSDSISKFSNFFKRYKPNLLIVLGDRLEILGVSLAASVHKIPIAHLNGGEVTAGAMDDWARHAITKMSSIHFVANKIYERRVIQLGEKPYSVYNVGGLSADNVKKTKLLKKDFLEKICKIKFEKQNFLVTYHPETLEIKKTKKLFNQILKALKKFKEVGIFFTAPNIDQNHLEIFELIKNFIKYKKNSYLVLNLGREKYLSLLKNCDVMIGNSSSGLLEAPYFNIPTINIGDRQKGRVRSKSVFDVDHNEKNITRSIYKIINTRKKYTVRGKKAYGNGKSAEKIAKILLKLDFKNIKLKKGFYDL